jgi:Cof subfamily protein (haloacid dehalogenase superfamily)
MIKLICSDIDGTLLNAERELSKKTIFEISKLKDQLPVILISSRMPSAMKHLQQQLGIETMPFVAYNGGLISVNNKIMQSTTISYELLKKIVSLNLDNLHLSLYHKDDWFAPQKDKWTKREIENTKVTPILASNLEVIDLWETDNLGPHKIMCMGEASLVDEFYNLLSQQMGEYLHLYRSKDTYIEIAPKKISKRSAIEFLISKEYKIQMNEVMSFGDNYNDIEMLKSSGLGLAVGNARKEVKQVADQVIGEAKKDGVGEFLSQYF